MMRRQSSTERDVLRVEPHVVMLEASWLMFVVPFDGFRVVVEKLLGMDTKRWEKRYDGWTVIIGRLVIYGDYGIGRVVH